MLQFYYLIDLHYSQTEDDKSAYVELFYYLIDLHYSQTLSHFAYAVFSFTTL